MQRIILHIDMNSYFASVEQQANPHLRGRSVGVCEHLGGIIIAPSVEAKRKGIKLGTPVWKAREIDPEIVLLYTDPDKYREVTRRFLDILRHYTDEVEQYSIDEAFMDITEVISSPPCEEGAGEVIENIARDKAESTMTPLKSPLTRGESREVFSNKQEEKERLAWNSALMFALEIKQRLNREVGEWVTASVGIGPNKLVAKIAADLDGGILKSEAQNPKSETNSNDRNSNTKTSLEFNYLNLDIVSSFDIRISDLDRICVVKPEQIEYLYDLLELTDVPGIGKRLERALNKLRIYSLKELADYPVNNLINHFGINGYFLHQMSNFQDDSFIITEPEPNKSIGHAYTLPRVIRNEAEIKGLLMKLAEKMGRRMRGTGARGNIISLFYSGPPHLALSPQGRGIKGEGPFHKRKKISEFINTGKDIYKYGWKILKDSCHNPLQLPLILRGRVPPLKVRGGKGELCAIKIMGISISGLRYDRPQDFLLEEFKKPIWLTEALDKINDKYGEYTVGPGLLLGAERSWAKDTVGFGRMK